VRGPASEKPARGGRSGVWLILVAALGLAGAGWMFRGEIMASKWWPGGQAGARTADGPTAAPSDDGDHRRRRPAQRH
jgi:hypothetical protein